MRTGRAASWLGAALGLLASVAWGDAFVPGAPEPVELGAAERARLAEGGLVLEPLEPTGGQGIALRALGLVEAPPARVWPVVRDCHRFAEFMPRTKHSERRRAPDGAATCYLVMDLPFPLADVHSEVRTRYERLPEGGFRRRWSLLGGDYARNQGSWTVLPWDAEGRRSLLVYQIDAHPKQMLPDFVLRAAQQRQLPATYRAIEARARTEP